MRKFLPAFFFLFLACTHDSVEHTTDFTAKALENDQMLTEIEAVEVLNDFISKLPQTRSSTSSLKVVSCVKKNASDYYRNGLSDIITRSAMDGVDVNVVPVYELQTESPEGKGFGIVLGDRRFGEVIAFSPKGSLSDTVFNEGLACFTASIPYLIYENLSLEQRKNEMTRGYWQPEPDPQWGGLFYTDYDNMVKKEDFNSYEEARAAYPDDHGPWDEFDTPARFLPVKWGQEAPYNNNAPINTTLNITSRAGCGPVAVAQVMAYHRHPKTYNWSLLTASQSISPSQTEAAQEVARLMRDAGEALNANYQRVLTDPETGNKKPATGITSQSVIPGLAKFGYVSEMLFENQEDLSHDVLRDNLVKYGPVLLSSERAFKSGIDLGGHIWVVDALYKKTRNYYQIGYGWDWTPNGSIPFAFVNVYRQYFITFHCNWGWNGSSDGYYYNFIPINERYRFRQFSLWNVKLNS